MKLQHNQKYSRLNESYRGHILSPTFDSISSQRLYIKLKSTNAYNIKRQRYGTMQKISEIFHCKR